MTVPLVTIYLNKRKRDAVYYGIIAGLAIGISILFYQNYTANLENPCNELPEMSQILVDKGYQNDYVGFWQANVLTEISDGKIEVNKV